MLCTLVVRHERKRKGVTPQRRREEYTARPSHPYHWRSGDGATEAALAALGLHGLDRFSKGAIEFPLIARLEQRYQPLSK